MRPRLGISCVFYTQEVPKNRPMSESMVLDFDSRRQKSNKNTVKYSVAEVENSFLQSRGALLVSWRIQVFSA